MVNFITIRGHGENLQGFSLQQAVLDSTGYFGLQQDIWEILVRYLLITDEQTRERHHH